jgi:uncharacterized protein (DUF58 family)
MYYKMDGHFNERVCMHISAETSTQIRHVELYTRRLLRGFLMGASRSGMKGLGFEFDQLREYQIGDDVRSIDWRSSARMQSILVKQYLEERNRTVLLMIDVSTSMRYGFEEKYQRVAWIASIVILIAAYGGDKVGLMLYSDVMECYIPPRTGLSHARRLMRLLFEHVPKQCTTKILNACKQIRSLKERSLVCVISDFIDEELDTAIGGVAQRHELLAIRYLDRCERMLPVAGLLTMRDQETGHQYVADVSASAITRMRSFLATRISEQDRIFKKYGVSILDSVVQDRFIQELVGLLRSRMRY